MSTQVWPDSHTTAKKKGAPMPSSCRWISQCRPSTLLARVQPCKGINANRWHLLRQQDQDTAVSKVSVSRLGSPVPT